MFLSQNVFYNVVTLPDTEIHLQSMSDLRHTDVKIRCSITDINKISKRVQMRSLRLRDTFLIYAALGIAGLYVSRF